MDISKLENWFHERCNGDWEHQGGISIETTDNPGWYVPVDFDWVEHPFSKTSLPENVVRSEEDHIEFHFDSELNRLRIACGPLNLGAVLEAFLIYEG